MSEAGRMERPEARVAGLRSCWGLAELLGARGEAGKRGWRAAGQESAGQGDKHVLTRDVLKRCSARGRTFGWSSPAARPPR